MERELTLVFDIETDGLKEDVTTIHCVSIYDAETNNIISYNDSGDSEPVIRGVQRLHDADVIIGHNVISYDVPVIKKIYPWFEPTTVIDTLLLSRLYHPDMMGVDKANNWPNMPLGMYGRHSLESYGYRLGEYKGAFGKTSDWTNYSQEMQDYCEQDVKVTTKLWKHFHKYLNG
jgi:hypothetical protein|tara:strand:- start:10849 stop:11370 length:522 start_codon:yes stop_codon:yes gene_type:complete